MNLAKTDYVPPLSARFSKLRYSTKSARLSRIRYQANTEKLSSRKLVVHYQVDDLNGPIVTFNEIRAFEQKQDDALLQVIPQEFVPLTIRRNRSIVTELEEINQQIAIQNFQSSKKSKSRKDLRLKEVGTM